MSTLPLLLLALGATAGPIGAPIASPVAPAAIAAVTIARDPADSLYKAAREALANGDYDRAARLFHDVAAQYPKSALVPDAMYYEAFARYRNGASGDLEQARALLDAVRVRYPSYAGRAEANALATRVCGVLAQQGDAACAASITAEAQATGVAAQATMAEAQTTAAEAQATAAEAQATAAGAMRHARSDDQVPGCGSGDDDRVAALNALLQMDADRAMPILDKVLARRDACSAPLRRKAVFLVSQKQTPQTVDVLLRVAQNDPDPRVREQAVFWLSQVPGDRTVTVLSDILRKSSDPAIRDKAIFALSQSRSDRARQLLREYATDASAPVALREKAIFWMGQDQAAGTSEYLESLYTKLSDPALREKALFALSQRHDAATSAWLLDLAKRTSEPLELRKKALFFASESGASTAQIASLYDALPAGPMREQAVFALSQRRDPAAVDKLIAIARSDKDPEARKKAIFWLGQSRDPRAAQYLSELIDK